MRPSIDATFLDIVKVLAKRSTCARRAVGALTVDFNHNVLSTGYNGVAKGMVHCTSKKCPGADAPSGTKLDACLAIHAESNALLQCPDVMNIHTIYVTASPCINCTKLLLNTSCRRIVFLEKYPHGEAKDLWESAGREWCHITEKHNG